MVGGNLETVEKDEGEYFFNLTFTIESELETDTFFNVTTKDSMGQKVGFSSLGSFNSDDNLALKKGKNTFSVQMDASYLAIGTYFLNIDLGIHNVRYFDRCEDCFSFDIEKSSRGDHQRALRQSWGLGSVEIPIIRTDQTPK